MDQDNLALLVCFGIAIIIIGLMPKFFQGESLETVGKFLGLVVVLYIVYKLLTWVHIQVSTH